MLDAQDWAKSQPVDAEGKWQGGGINVKERNGLKPTHVIHFMHQKQCTCGFRGRLFKLVATIGRTDPNKMQ